MRGMRRAVGFVAILAIALHGLLLSLAPLAASAAVDPFTVICHSDAADAPGEDQSPASPDIGAQWLRSLQPVQRRGGARRR